MSDEIKISAQSLLRVLTQASMPVAGHRLFETLALEFKQDSIDVVVTNEAQDAMLVGSWKPKDYLPISLPVAPVIVSPEDWETYLKRFKEGEVISVTFDGMVQLKGEKKTFKHFPQAELKALRPEKTPVVKDGVVHFAGGTIPAATLVKVSAEEFHDVIADAEAVEVPLFPLHFGETESLARLGSTEAKHDSVDTRITATVTGPPYSAVFGSILIYTMRSLSGPIELQTSTGRVLCIISKSDDRSILVALAPKLETR